MNVRPISAQLQMQVENLKNKIPAPFYKIIDIDEGWYQIVVDCDKELTAINPSYNITQIKEKFGGLRYYIKPVGANSDQTNDMYKVIARYEKIASKTCEATGLPGVLMKSVGGWYKTLNPEYAASKKHYARYKVVKNLPSEDEWWDANK